MIIGHRGACGLETENTLAAIKTGYLYADAVEIDLRLTKDHQLILHHDATLERIYGIEKRISQLTLPELKELTKNEKHPIASLEEALEIIGSRPVFLELKDNGSAEVLTNILQNYPECLPTGIISYKKTELSYITERALPYRIFFIPNKRNFLFSVSIAKRIKANGIIPHISSIISPLHLYWARKAKLQVVIFPVNSIRTARFLKRYIKNVALETDFPNLLKNL